MAIANLTARKVESLKPTPGRQVEYWDASRAAFGLRLSPNGTKTWVLRYRHRRLQRRLKIGTYPAMKLAEARQLADDMKASVEKGEDPFADRLREKSAETFADLAQEYMTRHAIPKKKTWREDQRVLDKDVLPRWRHLRPNEIRRADVRQLIETVADRGSPIQANHHLALIRKIFNFAIERDWLEFNPCHMVKKPGKERPRERVLTPEEIRRFWAATETEPPPIRAAFRLRLLTAQRGGEVLNMRWQDIDLETKWWVIPSQFAKNGLSHRVPLNGQSVAILEELRDWLQLRIVEINVWPREEAPRTKGVQRLGVSIALVR